MKAEFLSCGDTAFSVQFGFAIEPEANARVMALHAAIGRERAAGRLAGVVETVPSARALLVCYDPLSSSRAALQPLVERLLAAGKVEGAAGRRLVVPCCYDDPEFGPDLDAVAERTGLSRTAVIDRHLGSVFKVYVLGFMPGLAYMAGLAPALELPRRSQPRVRVPRSSVAIAMNMTTIYPFESPGGWHLLGRTPLMMFDKRLKRPVLLAPGDEVRFRAIDRREHDRIETEVAAGAFDLARVILGPADGASA